MKREIALILSLLPGQFILSQDWQLFVKNQVSYYKQQYANTILVENFLVDSVFSNNEKETLLFNSKSEISDNCYSKLRQDFMSYRHVINNPKKIDSLVCSNDSVMFITNYTPNIDTFLFKPYSNVGDSWNIKSIIIDKRGSWITNSIKIECSEKKVINIFGTQDSVKIFRCKGSPYDTIEFILSKSFGLIKFLPLNEFICHFLEISLEPYFELIGYSYSNISKGYTQPDFSDYFHLSEGDILVWREHSDPPIITEPETTKYYLDSVIYAYISPDSVYYAFEHKGFYANGETFHLYYYSDFHLRKDEGKILSGLTSWYGFNNDRHSNLEDEIYFLNSIYLNTENEDTITILGYSLPGLYYHTNNCYVNTVPDYYYAFGFSTREGFISWSSYYWDMTLIGSIINGIKQGTIKIQSLLNNISYEDISIFPNPVIDNLSIISPSIPLTKIELYDIMGKLIFSKQYNETLDLKKISSGIYVLRLIDKNNKLINFKILKQ